MAVCFFVYGQNQTVIVNSLISNRMHVANGGFSNISIIQRSGEQYVFVNGENWISFPTLPRQGNNGVNTQSVLENITPLPFSFSLEGRVDNSDISHVATKQGSNWDISDLPTVKSSKGYILDITETPQPDYLLPYSGTRLNPNTPITIYEGHKNWVGYFLPEQQDPFDALSNVLYYLKTIKGQYWAAANMGTPDKPNWISSEPYPLKHADMLILEPFNTTTFVWHRMGTPGEESTFEDTQHFTYTPSGDYTPVFIEIDSTDRPLEIGAMVNDSCIGATKVNAADTIVLIRSYVDNNSGDSVIFEKYYGTKSTEKYKVRNYFVYNPEKHSSEKRCIRTNEHKDFYLISFKNKLKDIAPADYNLLTVKVYPNPVVNNLNVMYNLSYNTNITLELYNLNGQIIKVLLQNEFKNAGVYHEYWSLKGLNNQNIINGVYILKMKTSRDTVFKKIIIQ